MKMQVVIELPAGSPQSAKLLSSTPRRMLPGGTREPLCPPHRRMPQGQKKPRLEAPGLQCGHTLSRVVEQLHPPPEERALTPHSGAQPAVMWFQPVSRPASLTTTANNLLLPVHRRQFSS